MQIGMQGIVRLFTFRCKFELENSTLLPFDYNIIVIFIIFLPYLFCHQILHEMYIFHTSSISFALEVVFFIKKITSQYQAF